MKALARRLRAARTKFSFSIAFRASDLPVRRIARVRDRAVVRAGGGISSKKAQWSAISMPATKPSRLPLLFAE